MRQHVEREIAAAAIKGLLDAGHRVTVYNGEEDVLTDSRDSAAILSAMFTTDEDWLQVDVEGGRPGGWVRFIYGNDGWDVINDYSTNLEAELTAANARGDYWSGSDNV